MIGLYAIVHLPTNRAYFGSSSDIKRRIKEHRGKLRSGGHHCVPLQRAWSKYGESQFEFRPLCAVTSVDEVRMLEQSFLEMFFKDGLYNTRLSATGFGCGDSHPTKNGWNIKDYMASLTPKERQAKYGKTKGRKRDGAPYVIAAAKRLADPEFRAKLSAACKGKRQVLTCPHCGLEGGGGNMRRYHFDKCGAKR